jgi:KUP system potassium uptake protein
MTFWTWAKGLEDAFDGANRQNLRRFIIPRDQDGDSSKFDDFSAAHGDIEEAHDPTSSFSTEKTQLGYDYVAPKIQDSNSTDEQRNELVRINSCAVFYRLSAGTGVPHSFVGFIRRWPALPRVVVRLFGAVPRSFVNVLQIFLSVRVLPIARVAEEERYMINKVSAVEGFYTTTYYIGFRDDFDVQVPQIVEKICALEQRSGGDPIKVTERVQTVRRCASEAMTHVVPHYHVLSKPVNAGFMSGPVNFIRHYLIESVYQHVAAMFPETENWLSSADECVDFFMCCSGWLTGLCSIIHVGVNASI